MSGGGGGSWTTPTGDSCERLTSETTLTSPDRAVISRLSAGELLDVEVDSSGASPVVRAVYQGQIAGSITSSIIQKIVGASAMATNTSRKYSMRREARAGCACVQSDFRAYCSRRLLS